MNGRKAKMLRRMAKFHPADDRVQRPIVRTIGALMAGGAGQPKLLYVGRHRRYAPKGAVESPVRRTQIVSDPGSPRAIYQHLKEVV